MATYIKIASSTVGSGGAASVTFSSIPATFTDLVLKASERNTSTGTVNGKLTFNGTTTGYSERLLYVSGSTASSANQSTSSFAWATVMYGSDATANSFSSSDIYIPNYRTANNKTISTESAAEQNTTTANIWFDVGAWANTAAITSLTMTASSGNYAQYSTFTLYGISNA
jgi:hypothetical protein